MKKGKDLQSLYSKGFVSLQENEEGQLRGGFAVLGASIGNNCDCDTLPNNCKCNGNNCDCPPKTSGNNCTCDGNNCDCKLTVPVPTSAPTSAPMSLAGMFISF